MEDSRVKRASTLLSSFFDQETLKKGQDYAQFNHAWKSIAGSRLGDHSRPADIRHGVLIVETEHSGWIQLLQLHQEKILDEIGRRYPDLGITGLAFRIGNDAQNGSNEIAPPAKEEKKAVAEAPEQVGAQSGAAGPFPAPQMEHDLPPELKRLFARIKRNIEK